MWQFAKLILCQRFKINDFEFVVSRHKMRPLPDEESRNSQTGVEYLS